MKDSSASKFSLPAGLEFLDSIIENIPDMIFMKEARELRFVRFNRAGEELLGYKREELIGKNDFDFFPREQADSFTAKDREVLAGRSVVEIPEEPIATRYKGERILHTKKVPLYDANGEAVYLLGISEDITDKKRAHESLILKTEELARSRAELEQLELFAFAATHDFQEPLRKMNFYADLLGRKFQPGDDEARQFLSQIVETSARMQLMMDELRELSRIGTEGRPFLPVSMDAIFQKLQMELKEEIRTSSARIDMEPVPPVYGDAVQIELLFRNLLMNAIKFRRPGTAPEIHVRARTAEGGTVEIRVEDNGTGFDEQYLGRIFKPFHRLHSRDYAGTGIGLAICRKIVIRHQGRITAVSRPGQGSTFIVTLPLAES